MNYPFNLLKQVPVLSVACILPRMLYSLENVCRPPVIVISRCQLEKSTEMKVWNEKALQTSPSLSLVLGFIFVLKESFFAILVLYQEGCGVMRYFGVERRETMTKKREKSLLCKCSCQFNCYGDFGPPSQASFGIIWAVYDVSPEARLWSLDCSHSDGRS